MSQVIRISDDLYNRLKGHAEGFDTPASVIEKVLDTYEANGYSPIVKVESVEEALDLEINFSGMSEEKFKQGLLKQKHCYVSRHFTDGTQDTKRWNASKLTHDSSVVGNLRSGLLRGWRKKGIYKADLSLGEPASSE